MKVFIFFSFLLLLFNNSSLLAQTNNGSAFDDGFSGMIIESTNPPNENANLTALSSEKTAITLEAWVFPIDIPEQNDENIFLELYSYDNNGPKKWFAFQLGIVRTTANNLAGVKFSISDGANEENIGEVISEETIIPETWNHIAATYDGSNLKIYVNGDIKITMNHTGIIKLRDTGNAQYFFTNIKNGLIDDVRIWNAAQSQLEIETNMNVVLTGNESGLIGYWPLDSAIDNVTIDKTDSHNDLRTYTQFVRTTVQTPSGSTKEIVVNNTLIDFGEIELKQSVSSGIIELQNSGDAPLYGKVEIDNPRVVVIPYGSRFFVDAGGTSELTLYIQPTKKGDIYANITFFNSNADNPNEKIPIHIIGVRELGIDANNIDMWINPNGVFAFDYSTRTSGLEWPKFSNKHVVFSSGVWVGAKVGDEIHTAVSAYSSGIEEFEPGPIYNEGEIEEPDKHRVFKIHTGDTDSNPDFRDWPGQWGAPVDNIGRPKPLADQTIFVIYNDQNETNHERIASTPLGAEIQQTIFAWDEPGDLGNTIFLRFKLVNKSEDFWEDTYFALWSDPDIGEPSDDFVGVDVGRNMGYSYNSSNFDEKYGFGPPAVGYTILKGAYYTKPIQAFAYYASTLPYDFFDPSQGYECYNYLQGLNRVGDPYIDEDEVATVFPLSGDPLTGDGWIDKIAGDRRFLLSTGPFDLYPGQAKEIVAAIIVARDSTGGANDYLNSITALKNSCDVIQAKYDEGNLFGGALENVTVEQIEPEEGEVTIDDLENSGTQLDIEAVDDTVTVEVASFIEEPPGTDQIEHSAIHGVGKYIDVQVNGEIKWPIDSIKIWYTQADLDEANVNEEDLRGIYYWHNTPSERWVPYDSSNTLSDDPQQTMAEDTSQTGVIRKRKDGYLGYAWAIAYHLTPMRIGTKIDSVLIGIDYKTVAVKSFYLKQNYPNPFNPNTTIEFGLPKFAYVSIKLYDINGRFVKTVFSGNKTAGTHFVQFDGSQLSSGIYIYTIHAGNYFSSKKMVFMK